MALTMNTTIQNGADPAAHMSPAPVGFGRPCTERAAWTARAETALGRQVCAEAERAAATPLPPLGNNTYLEFSRTGSRTEWERRLWQHHHALTMWTP